MEIKETIAKVNTDRLRQDLFHLSKDPLPFRKANYTRPGASVSSLDETDTYICEQLAETGCEIRETNHRVQAFRCDETKPLHHWYSKPEPDDPWYDVRNIEAVFPGSERPEEIVQLISHKDSMSWIDSPGARDNGVGLVANLELARILGEVELKRTVRILFCNEEHRPWTSIDGAESAAKRGDNLIAVLNVDSLDGKSDADTAAGKMTHVVTYSTDEGRALADQVASCTDRYPIALAPEVVFKEKVNDDDGMFIKAGYSRTVMNVGSFPYEDAQYHLVGDVPARVNFENVAESVKLILAAVMEICEGGEGCF